MAEHIPFVTSESSLRVANRIYSDSRYFRIALDRLDLARSLSSDGALWLDACIDGMDDVAKRQQEAKPSPWLKCLSGLPNFEKLASPGDQASPNKQAVIDFVSALLDKCIQSNPTWITVPQLPERKNVARNKLNRLLAVATGEWKARSNFRGSLILPLIITHQSQIGNKTARNPRVIQAEKRYVESSSDGLWVVDADLKDESGSATLMIRRFPAVIALHEELNAKIACLQRIGGPYWGLNLVLWAKGLIDFPAIGVGTGYQYQLSAAPGVRRRPSQRLALPPLRRRAVAAPPLVQWLQASLAKLSPSHPAHNEFAAIKREFSLLTTDSREQVARFYKAWFDSIAAIPKAGRSLGLFQDLSAAYALGKPLRDLDDPVRRPEAVAEPLMLSCL